MEITKIIGESILVKLKVWPEKRFDEARPADGQAIEALFPDGKWYTGTYFDDGLDGVVESEDNVTEIEEYPEMMWRPIQPLKEE